MALANLQASLWMFDGAQSLQATLANVYFADAYYDIRDGGDDPVQECPDCHPAHRGLAGPPVKLFLARPGLGWHSSVDFMVEPIKSARAL